MAIESTERAGWKTAILVASSLPFLIAARWWWQAHPGIWPCVLFWTLALADDPLRWAEMGSRRRFFYGLTFVGACGNAIATLANGGYMPVLGKTEPTSVWVPLTEAARVPWLCDIYAGASLGDIFIASGLIALLCNWLLEKADVIDREAFAVNKRIPGFGIG